MFCIYCGTWHIRYPIQIQIKLIINTIIIMVNSWIPFSGLVVIYT